MKSLQKLFIAILFSLSQLRISLAGTVTLEWDPSPDPDVVGFNLYYGGFSQEYTNLVPVGLANTATLTNLTEGVDYYLAATSINSIGLESDYSVEISFHLFRSATVHLANLNQAYDGSVKSVVVDTEPAGLPLNLTYNGHDTPPTEAGVYAISAAVHDPLYAGQASGTLVVAPAKGAILLRDLDQIYDGSPKQVWAMTSPPGLALDLTYDGGYNFPVNPGTYQVVATIEDNNYVATQTVSLVIQKGRLPLSLSNLNQVYDGLPKPVLAGPVPGTATVQVTYNGSFQAPTAAGTYSVQAVLLGLSNYTGVATGMLSVAKAKPAIQFANLDQLSNGDPKPVTATTLPPGCKVNLTYNGQTQPPSAPGIYRVVGAVDDLNWQGLTQSVLTISAQAAGGIPRNPNHPAVPYLLSASAPPTAAAAPSVLLSWPLSANSIRVWRSSDFSNWTQVTNLSSSSNSLAVTLSPSPLFFRATSSGTGSVNIPLSIRKP